MNWKLNFMKNSIKTEYNDRFTLKKESELALDKAI